jgi:3-deoxy-D-manno-octulosonate 8-phosphate phosphatase (KDO 8-P phosphatase)
MSLNFKEKLGRVKAIIFDVDGVLGSNKLLLQPNGEMLRFMNIKDGYAIQYAIKQGMLMAIISGGNNESVRTRFSNLGIKDIYLKSQNKIDNFNEFVQKYELDPETILYMGDDIPDYEVMSKVGVACCPADAAIDIKGISMYVSPFAGGDGCARDIIEQVLKVQGLWMTNDAVKW